MTAYQIALRRYRRALASSKAAPGDRDAADELRAAGDLMLCFAINPEYRGPRHMTGASA